MGSEKWLDLEVWNSTRDCFNVLKSRGYRIATTHLGIDTVSIYDMDWSCPTAIVVGNENRTSRMNVLAAMHKSSVVHRLRKYGSSTRHGLNPDFVDLEGQLTHEAPREDEKDLESGLVCQV